MKKSVLIIIAGLMLTMATTGCGEKAIEQSTEAEVEAYTPKQSANDIEETKVVEDIKKYELSVGEEFDLTNIVELSLKEAAPNHWAFPFDVEIPVLDYDHKVLGVDADNEAGFWWEYDSEQKAGMVPKDHVSIKWSVYDGTDNSSFLKKSEHGTYVFSSTDDMLEKVIPTSRKGNAYIEENTVSNGSYTLYYYIEIWGNTLSDAKMTMNLRNNSNIDSASEELFTMEYIIYKSFHENKGEAELDLYKKVIDGFIDALGVSQEEAAKTVKLDGSDSPKVDTGSVAAVEISAPATPAVQPIEDTAGDENVIGDSDLSVSSAVDGCSSWMLGLDVGCPKYNGNVADFDYSFYFPSPGFTQAEADGYIEATINDVYVIVLVEAVDASRMNGLEMLYDSNGKQVGRYVSNDARKSFSAEYYMTAPRSTEYICKISISFSSNNEHAFADFQMNYMPAFEESLVSNML